MKVLYLAHRIPFPPNKGDKIRSFNVIRHLSRRHEIWCACFADNSTELQYAAALRKYCRDVVVVPLNRPRALLRALVDLTLDESATQGFYRDERMVAAVRALGQRVSFDAVMVYSSSMAQYADHLWAARKIIDLCDLDSRKWADFARGHRPPRSWLFAAEARRLERLEREIHARFDATVLIGEHEARDWPVPRRDKLFFVGNGVRTTPFPDDRVYDSGIVGFVGDMRYYPNEDAAHWFVREVWPCVRRTFHRGRFEIIGRSPSRSIRRLGRRGDVRVIGTVPRVFDHLLRCQLIVAPLRIARGIQNKVLEAMAAAAPVVLTAAAASGIEAAPGTHFIVADDPQAFAEEVVALLGDPQRCRRIGRAARDFVASRHGWQQQLASLESILTGTGRPAAEDLDRGAQRTGTNAAGRPAISPCRG